MHRFTLLILLSFLLPSTLFSSLRGFPHSSRIETTQTDSISTTDTLKILYEKINLEGLIDLPAFKQAVVGYHKIPHKQKEILTFIDFTKPSDQERLFVLDMSSQRLLYKTVVAHGKRSGEKYARTFSNREGSHMSSVGFYLTRDTYLGNNGYSLRLEGLEKGFNSRAWEREIVVHGAKYADPSIIKKEGRLGRSHGCPAIPHSITKPIIDVIKEGSVLYIHADLKEYHQKSPILNS